ncbi:MAG: LuxR C-terminal-related transcriptional regulator [Candidatus Dormibacteria bacterium]
MLTAVGSLERGREAFNRKRWSEALAALTAAEITAPLASADYEMLTISDYLLHTDARGAESWERAFAVFIDRGDIERAARATFWLGMNLAGRGETARANGWISRGRRLLDEADLDSSARGYLLIPSIIQAAAAGELDAATRIGEEATEIGRRHHDRDLLTLIRHGQGRILLQAGRISEGLPILDEIMVAIGAGEVSPLVVGIIYCSVVDALSAIYDTARMQEWTDSLTRWCEDQPDLEMYLGQCMVHRAQLLQFHGQWPAALDHAGMACERFVGPPPHPGLGNALYEQAEIRRLQGDVAGAEEAFGRAAELGHSAQPGLALLRLAEGRAEVAEAAIRRALAETVNDAARAAILPAATEILVASDDLAGARTAADELLQIAETLGSDYLRAAAAAARGEIALVDGEPAPALTELRTAAKAWQRLDAPYQKARVSVLLGLACRELGDEEGATRGFETARGIFANLSAAPDLARLQDIATPRPPAAPAGLTGREVQLLALLATGKTNRQLAAALGISEKTVARHISNIFNKLGVSSRAAATAYAFHHHLT